MDLSGRPLTAAQADESLFINRRSEVAEVTRAIQARTNVLVLGDRGAGKTSFLHHLERELSSGGVRSVFVDGSVTEDAGDFLRLLSYRIAPRRTPDLEWRRDRMPPSAALLEQVRDLERTLDRETAPTAVLVDELVPAEVGHILFGRLRDELWRISLVWIVAASSADRLTYLRPPADAFFGRVINLEPFDSDAATELLVTRLGETLPPREVRAIVEASDGSPRRLISLAAEATIAGHPVSRVAKRQKVRDHARSVLSETERRVIADIEASGAISASDGAFLNRVGISRSRAAQVLTELERRGILRGSFERAQGRRPRKLYELV